MSDTRSLDIYIATRPEDRKRTKVRTITLGPKESPPATIEHEDITYTWRHSHPKEGWVLYVAVTRG